MYWPHFPDSSSFLSSFSFWQDFFTHLCWMDFYKSYIKNKMWIIIINGAHWHLSVPPEGHHKGVDCLYVAESCISCVCRQKSQSQTGPVGSVSVWGFRSSYDGFSDQKMCTPTGLQPFPSLRPKKLIFYLFYMLNLHVRWFEKMILLKTKKRNRGSLKVPVLEFFSSNNSWEYLLIL